MDTRGQKVIYWFPEKTQPIKDIAALTIELERIRLGWQRPPPYLPTVLYSYF